MKPLKKLFLIGTIATSMLFTSCQNLLIPQLVGDYNLLMPSFNIEIYEEDQLTLSKQIIDFNSLISY